LFYVRGNSKGECPASLVNEATCASGILKYKDGFWHDGLELNAPRKTVGGSNIYAYRERANLTKFSKFYRCRGSCTADNNGSVTCQRGAQGVLCGLCSDGYVAGLSGKCDSCEMSASDLGFIGWILTFIAVGLAVVGARGYGRFVRYEALLFDLQDKLTSKFKLLVAFFSIALMIGNVYQVRWPEGYLDFLSSFRIFAFDLFDTLRVGCLVRYDAHSAMYGEWVSSVSVDPDPPYISGHTFTDWFLSLSTLQTQPPGLSAFLLALEAGVIIDLLPTMFPSKCASTAKRSRKFVATQLLITVSVD
jgi:hypothetical protein